MLKKEKLVKTLPYIVAGVIFVSITLVFLSPVLDGKILNQHDTMNFCKNVPTYWGEQPFTSGSVYVGAIVHEVVKRKRNAVMKNG